MKTCWKNKTTTQPNFLLFRWAPCVQKNNNHYQNKFFQDLKKTKNNQHQNDLQQYNYSPLMTALLNFFFKIHPAVLPPHFFFFIFFFFFDEKWLFHFCNELAMDVLLTTSSSSICVLWLHDIKPPWSAARGHDNTSCCLLLFIFFCFVEKTLSNQSWGGLLNASWDTQWY